MRTDHNDDIRLCCLTMVIRKEAPFYQRLHIFCSKDVFPIFGTLEPLFTLEVEPIFFVGVCFLFYKTLKPLFSSEANLFFILAVCFLFLKHQSLFFRQKLSPLF
jgi:hypothetical protein